MCESFKAEISFIIINTESKNSCFAHLQSAYYVSDSVLRLKEYKLFDSQINTIRYALLLWPCY